MKTNIVLFFVLSLVTLTLLSFNTSHYNTNQDPFIVVLDAGHGGKDPGKHSKFGYNEKDIALKIVLEVGRQLERNPNIKVVYTRKTDVFIELKDRAKIANKANADLFVSIHCNAHHTDVSGTETYVLDVANTNRNLEVAKAENEVILLEDDYEKHYKGFNPNAPESLIGITLAQEEYTDQSILLASLIERNFVNQLNRKSRGVKQASLWVIHQTAMPSVLIETGFVTNKEEGDYLNSDRGQQGISKAIVSAILDYKANLDSNVSDLLSAVTVKQSGHVATSNEVPVNNVNKPDNFENSIKNIESNSTKSTSLSSNILFKVQIAASSKSVETKPQNFKGLSNVSMAKEGSLYKYFYGKSSSYQDILKLSEEAKNKGYVNSFVVAFKEDKKIPLSEALKTISN